MTVAIITGGTRGIGAATARRVAGDGYTLCLTYRSRKEDAERLAAALRDAGATAHLVRCDVTDPSDVERLFATADEMGPLAALVNNAGIVEQKTDFVDIDLDRWERMFAANVYGTALCCRAAVRRMARSLGGDGGAIVNVSSRAAVMGSPHTYVDYAASKAAVDTLSRGLALELAADGVRVNVVRPGIIDTEIHADSGDPARAQKVGPSLPMGRVGEPTEVAEAIAWLLSPAASYVTGAFLDVAGGR